MSVIAFPRRKSTARGAGWRDDELRALVAGFDASQARSWDVGATERGDPQFYVLGPAPDRRVRWT